MNCTLKHASTNTRKLLSAHCTVNGFFRNKNQYGHIEVEESFISEFVVYKAYLICLYSLETRQLFCHEVLMVPFNLY